ncbi:unnamed protein product [Trifolium pratense]|uniref:Uncharacterized protein n=1 Tax=Trifolium pratense TaxID=57577 RepID=A0ACB0KYQ7_TRIPR|nr:unnamed protein product [Trifolium pratense]
MILSPHEWIFLTKTRLQNSNSINNRIDYYHNFENNRRRRSKVTTVVCGLRSYKNKKPPTQMVISKESVQRQNQLHLSLKVLEFIINDEEAGYDELLLPLYSDTILLLGKNKMIEMAEEMFNRVVEKGLKPDTRLFNEMIGAYLQVDNTEKAMNLYRSMKDSGCLPDELTFTILIKNLLKNGEHELVETLKKESFDYVNEHDKFVQRVQQKHAKKKHIKLVM